jgi:DNA excision repair protein ERCC-2
MGPLTGEKLSASMPEPGTDRSAPVQKPVYTVPVRELVEFVWRRGDLGGSGDFVGSDRALRGTRGHQRIQRSRPAGYRKEVSISRDIDSGELILKVQGRIDGILTADETVVIEEIKTVRGGWAGATDPLHWAQARIYAFMHAKDQRLESIGIRLVYLDLDSGKVTEFRENATMPDLSAFFDQTLAVYLEWIRDLHQWRQIRNGSIRSLHFPFASYRPGQRQIAVAVYRTLVRGGRLFIEAPTGIGKTASVLFPAIKAFGEGRLERLFYLTARTVGRLVAEQAIAGLRSAGLRLRSLTLTARDKLCVHHDHPCDLTTCPLARGYYDRRHAAMRSALDRESLTRIELEAVSRQHQVCPFELSLDVSMWVDAVVCDYNYVFDPQAYLRRHFQDPRDTVAFLVDEAHNLVERARAMFSADLTSQEIHSPRHQIRKTLPRCARALDRVHTALRKLTESPGASAVAPPSAEIQRDLFLSATVTSEILAGAIPAPEQPRTTGRNPLVKTRLDPPLELLAPIEEALKELETWLAQNQPTAFRDDLLALYFRLHAFRRTLELFDACYATIIETGDAVRVQLFCVNPSVLLRQALDRGKSAIFFSATLTPSDYYTALLGGNAEDPQLRMASPFDATRLAVLVHNRVRTQLRDRQASLPEIVASIGALVEGRPGNYMAYFPSYQYLAMAMDQFPGLYPHVVIRAQRPGMTESEREEFLAAFTHEAAGTQIGFAVMGGLFGEGIDLVGDRLIGAAIVGVGLPQLCVERDLIRDHFEKRTGAGFDYAYTFPGMNRVLQAIGRVIRSETDRGIVLLLDTRFARQRYCRLFPAWWQPIQVTGPQQVRTAIRTFWSQST